MAKTKSTEEKMKFIKDNIDLVPTKSKKNFNTWDVEKQYNKMVLYVSKSKKLNVASVVKSITDLNPSTSEVEKIVSKLQEWANSSTNRRIEAIKEEQKKLAKELKELTGK